MTADVGFIDTGGAVVIVPGGVSHLRRALLEAFSETDWQSARDGFGDPDLANA